MIQRYYNMNVQDFWKSNFFRIIFIVKLRGSFIVRARTPSEEIYSHNDLFIPRESSLLIWQQIYWRENLSAVHFIIYEEN